MQTPYVELDRGGAGKRKKKGSFKKKKRVGEKKRGPPCLALVQEGGGRWGPQKYLHREKGGVFEE